MDRPHGGTSSIRNGSMSTTIATVQSLAHELHAIAAAAWLQQENAIEPEALNLLSATPEDAAAVKRIGHQANDLGGFSAMQAVGRAAFCTAPNAEILRQWAALAASPNTSVVGSPMAAKDEMSSRAISELNFAWHGIGDWRA